MLLLVDHSNLDRLLAESHSAGLPIDAVAGLADGARLPQGLARWPDGSASVSGVLAAGTSPEVWKLIPEFLRQKHPVWVVMQAEPGSSAVYQLIPLDEEFPGQLRPIWNRTTAPAVVELRRQLASGDFGTVLQLQWETTVAGSPVFPIEEAEEAWLQDAAVLRSLVPDEFQRVTAIHSGIQPTGITTASVSLAGEAVPDAMWIYRRGAVVRSELTVTTDRGSAVVTWEGDQAPQLQVNCRPVECSGSAQRLAPVAEALRSPASDKASGGATWTDAVRTFDLLDAARRSIRRRRTVELQFESTTERSQFKTHMTTVGCGLLLATMFGLLGLLLVGRLGDPRDSQQKQAETVGFVLRHGDFEAGTAALNSLGQEHLAGIVTSYDRHSASILIEDPATPPGLGEQRRQLVIAQLRDARLNQPEVRTVIRPLGGVWFQRFMLGAWIILFLPLGIFLAVQLLITVTPEKDRNGK